MKEAVSLSPSRSSTEKLPGFIPPMVAQLGSPIDSAEHLFEIKWDGTRTLAFLDHDAYRLVNRHRVDMTESYPEFAFLSQLPSGIILDGEMVVLRDGKPDFGLLQSREHTRSALKVRLLARTLPATYVVFDVLYERYHSVMALPLLARREHLQKVVQRCGHPQLVLSEGVVGQGKDLFREACRQRLEGIMAKRLDSRYMPGRRSDAWLKIKRAETIHCAIIGFVPSGRKDFASLILAAEANGQVRCIGKVGTGFDNQLRIKLNQLLWARLREKPVVPCSLLGKWVEPGLYCTVRCMEWTPGGQLRAPAFGELYVE
jgi:DNA ligase D-like protein (predicted ligase)